MQLSASSATTPVAELHELLTPSGRIWRFVTRSEGVADHAWQQRERLLQLSNGALAVEVSWECEGNSPVNVTYSPQLPPAADLA